MPTAGGDADDAVLRPYVPGFVVDWLRDAPHTDQRTVDGTLVFADVSGFTTLTERLAARGKVGAEELTGLLDSTFAALLSVAYAHGAWLVKWGGDAVLLLFQGPEHAARACTAAVGMRRAMTSAGRLQTSVGPVRLRISLGVHSGPLHFLLVGGSHRELVVTGPGATRTAELEAAASAGEVAVSAQTAALLSAGCVRPRADGLLLLARSPGAVPGSAVRADAGAAVDLRTFLPEPTWRYLLTAGVDADAEHRLVSVAFVEFAGTDALLVAEGPGATASAVDHVVRSCQDAATRHGVTFWESDISKDGGKVMLVAGVPASTGADEDAMLAVAREVVDAAGVLPVRVGVNAGRVFFGQFGPPYRRTMSVKGDAVNLAARLMARAAPGEVLASSAVLDRARTAFAVEPLAPFLVKGKRIPVVAARVGPPQAAGAAAADAVPLVGRDHELRRLREAWHASRAGALHVVDLLGDAGSGKSRLLRELTSGRDDAQVVEVRCDPFTATTAYLPLRRAVRSLLGVPVEARPDEAGAHLRARLAEAAPELLPWAPLLGQVLDATVPTTAACDALDDRFRLVRQEEATVDLLTALLPGPAMLLVDDAHLLDPSTAAVLDRLPSRAPAAPCLVVRARRDDAGPGQEDDARVRVQLGPLSAAATLELLHAVTDDAPLAPHEAADLVARAGGNPLFLLELAAGRRAGVEDLPGTVEGVVAARIDRLRPADRRLLRAASVLGLDVDPAVLAALCGRAGTPLEPDALDRLTPFLEPAGAGLRFRQALVRETAYEGLAYSRRTALHGHLGDVLLERSGQRPEETAAVLSLHFERAGRDAEAARWARLAAQRAHAASAHAEAAVLYERALTTGRRAASGAGVDPAEAALWEALGDVRVRLGQFARADDAYRRARRGSRGAATDEARLLQRSAVCAVRTGGYRAALARLTAAGRRVQALPDGPDARLAASLAVARAEVRHWQGRHALAAAECRRALALAEGAADDERLDDVVAEALVWLDVSDLVRGRGDGADARRALALLERTGDRPWLLGRCLNELGIRAYYAGDWDGALRAYRACRAAFTDAGDAWAALMAQANEAEILADQGRPEQAEPLLRDALRGGRAAGAPGFVAFASGLLGRVAARTGRTEEALTLLRAARAQHEAIGEREEAAELDVRLAECLALAGDADGALALLDSVSDMTPLVLRVRAAALLRQHERERAEAVLHDSLALARERGAEHEVALTLRALAELAAARGEAVDAVLDDERRRLEQRLDLVAVPPAALLPAPA